jgi:hypothetical protein
MKIYKNMGELIKVNLNNDEYSETLNLINELKDVKKRGYLTKDEFMKIAM